jgi:16S rRNA (cytosine1402-N4)-methyltransferase
VRGQSVSCMDDEKIAMTEPTQPRPKRRPRYRGTHPRQFHEKYKELHPETYPETVQKVVESGKTPAGTHRPICLEEVMQVLAPKPGEIAVDATLGYGGHATEILRRILPGGRLIGFDTDPVELPKTEGRLRVLGFPSEALTIIHSNFAGMAKHLAAHGIAGVDMVLADLGCSSMQLDNPERGFSFKYAGSLDLRMNPSKGQPASTLVASLNVDELALLLRENGDEPHAHLIARSIAEAQTRRPLITTTALANVIRGALRSLPRQVREQEGDAPIRRVFQALRVAVNQEFTALDTFLRNLPDSLNPGARVAILTFHSGEDRRVKKAFQQGLRDGIFSDVARDVIRPGPEEVRANPRASSAKLRWAVKT